MITLYIYNMAMFVIPAIIFLISLLSRQVYGEELPKPFRTVAWTMLVNGIILQYMIT